MSIRADQRLPEAAAEPAGGDIPRHVAIIMDGNGRWAADTACRGAKATAAASRRCAGR